MEDPSNIKKVFDLTDEEFLSHNIKSTSHVQSYINRSMDDNFHECFTYLDNLRDDLPEYCEFGADKCNISNFREFCDSLDVDIADNLSSILKKLHNTFVNTYSIRLTPLRLTCYHFYNRDKTFMFTCSSPLYMEGSLGYFGCTGSLDYVIKAFDIIHKDGNRDLCYGGRDYI